MVAPGVEVIALGEHVDYWDQLGWKDRFSSPLFSARQQDYGKAFHLESVYTPQIVVNGQKEVLGSDSRAVQEAIGKAAKEPQAEVAIAMTSAQTVSFRVSKLPPGSHEAEILLGVTEGGLVTSVFGGENSGRQLRHAAVVRSLTSLGRLDPKRPGEYSAMAQLNLAAGLESRQSEAGAVRPGPDHAAHSGRGIGSPLAQYHQTYSWHWLFGSGSRPRRDVTIVGVSCQSGRYRD